MKGQNQNRPIKNIHPLEKIKIMEDQELWEIPSFDILCFNLLARAV